ncbi:2-hydroxyhepta-2,4-diene-1,7-dioate isomerase, partial [Schumannella luteola]
MRFARLGDPGAEIPVVDDEGSTFDLRPLTADIDADFLAADPATEVRRALHDRILDPVSAGMRFGPPIARPGKIVCIGLNYRDHAEETGASIPSEPIVFLKDPSTIVGPFDDVRIPRRSTKTDWEVELGVVIGRTARYLDSVEAAAEAISGYVLSHDVSEREFQL